MRDAAGGSDDRPALDHSTGGDRRLDWGDTEAPLPSGAPPEWRGILTGEIFRAGDSAASRKSLAWGEVQRLLPLALLEPVDG